VCYDYSLCAQRKLEVFDTKNRDIAYNFDKFHAPCHEDDTIALECPLNFPLLLSNASNLYETHRYLSLLKEKGIHKGSTLSVKIFPDNHEVMYKATSSYINTYPYILLWYTWFQDETIVAFQDRNPSAYRY
jgi:hypothetical protein